MTTVTGHAISRSHAPESSGTKCIIIDVLINGWT